MADTPSITGWLQGLVTRRPAESVTALTGGLGLLLMTTLGAESEARTALVVVLAALPSLISFLFDLGRFGPGGRGPAQRLNTELDQLTLRAVHRARAGPPGWGDDLDAVKALLNLQKTRGEITATASGQAPGGGGAPTT